MNIFLNSVEGLLKLTYKGCFRSWRERIISDSSVRVFFYNSKPTVSDAW